MSTTKPSPLHCLSALLLIASLSACNDNPNMMTSEPGQSNPSPGQSNPSNGTPSTSGGGADTTTSKNSGGTATSGNGGGTPAPGNGGGTATSGNGSETPPPTTNHCMSDIDKEMLKQINAARSTARNCGNRSFPAAPPLTWNCTLARVALEHSKDMADNNFFSHTGSDGLYPSQRITNAGYRWRSVAENIAAGQDTVSEVMAVWLSSPGHCANIMKSKYTEVGAARYINDNSHYRIYWTQDFATPRQ